MAEVVSASSRRDGASAMTAPQVPWRECQDREPEPVWRGIDEVRGYDERVGDGRADQTTDREP
jgi:hypothetical protein